MNKKPVVLSRRQLRGMIKEALEGALVPSLQKAMDELVAEFVRANKWDSAVGQSSGADRDAWSAALTQAASELHHVIDRDVRQVEESLMSGMYSDPVDDDLDDEEE